MNYMTLAEILNKQVTESIEYEEKTWVRLQWSDNLLFVTFFCDELLIQQIIECADPQVVPFWEFDFKLDELIYGLYIDYRCEFYWLELFYDPSDNTLVIKSEEEVLKKIDVSPERKISTNLPALDFLEENPRGKVVVSRKEWRKVQSAIAIARNAKAYDSILLEAIDDMAFIQVSGKSTSGLYCLTTQGSANLRDTIDFPFQVIEFLDSQYIDYGYVKFELYDEMVMIQADVNIRIFLPPCLKVKLPPAPTVSDTNACIRVGKGELIKAIKDVSGCFSVRLPELDKVTLRLSSPTTLWVEGKEGKGVHQLRVASIKNYGLARIIISASEMLDLLDALPDGELHLLLPTQHFEPMGINMAGIRLCYAGFYQEPRKFQKLPKNIGFWDAWEPLTQEVYSRETEESVLVMTAVEHSPLDVYKTVQELQIIDEDKRIDGTEMLRSPLDIAYTWGVDDFQELYRQVLKIRRRANILLESGGLSLERKAEVNLRLKEVQDLMTELHHIGTSPDVYHYGLVGEYLNTEVVAITECTVNLRVKAGRLLEAMLDQHKLYRLQMSMRPTQS